jgi:hypothetical protein
MAKSEFSVCPTQLITRLRLDKTELAVAVCWAPFTTTVKGWTDLAQIACQLVTGLRQAVVEENGPTIQTPPQ